MKAIVYERFGAPDRAPVRAIGKPAPAEDEERTRFREASVNPLAEAVRGVGEKHSRSQDVLEMEPA